ncbi:MAG: STAS domain-containing protein [Candidatus Cloacimonetes bacterium]|nr:STAS domain-containing protein [Candidatus Cloacimonadota bacterium]
MEAKIDNNTLELIFSNNLIASNLDHQLKTSKSFLSEHSDLKNIVLNLENVVEIDSLGINLVVGLYKQVTAEKRQFSVINTSKPIKNLFNLFKLSSYFDVS